MNTFRSLSTIQAVQFTGDEIAGITCTGLDADAMTNGCASSPLKHLLHVHTNTPGGLRVVKPGDWIFPIAGGPFGVATNEVFRASWEVPDLPSAAVPEQVPAAEIEPTVVTEPTALPPLPRPSAVPITPFAPKEPAARPPEPAAAATPAAAPKVDPPIVH